MWVKVSPLDDVQGIDALARVIDESEIVSTIVVSNTIPNQNRLRENGLPALTFNDGNHQGGLAGKALISRSLETLGNFTTLLPNHSFIGVGGIFTGQDALQYWRRGVDGFQCGTAFIEFGPQLFSDIYTQLAEKVA
jgi:dihydroorotate dehydrogenase